MLHPVPKRKIDIGVNDIVELVVRDRHLECAYVGQTGKVCRVDQNLLHVILRCGHPWSCRKDAVKKIGHEEPKEHLLSSLRRK